MVACIDCSPLFDTPVFPPRKVSLPYALLHSFEDKIADEDLALSLNSPMLEWPSFFISFFTPQFAACFFFSASFDSSFLPSSLYLCIHKQGCKKWPTNIIDGCTRPSEFWSAVHIYLLRLFTDTYCTYVIHGVQISRPITSRFTRVESETYNRCQPWDLR